MTLKSEVQALLEKLDPVIQSYLTKNQDQRPLMAVRNIEHLITTIESNQSVITAEVFVQIMTELNKDSLIELTDIYKVRNRITSLISAAGTTDAVKSVETPQLAPAAVSTQTKEIEPVKAAEVVTDNSAASAFEEPVANAAETSSKKLTATKNPVITVEEPQAEIPVSEPTPDPVVIEAEVVSTEPEATTDVGNLVQEVISELPEFPQASQSNQLPTVINVSSDTSEETAPRRGRKPGSTATKANLDNLVLQLLNKLEERESRISELEKRVEELEQDVAASVKVTPALAKRLEKFGIQV